MAVDINALQTAVETSIATEMSAYTAEMFAQQGITATVDYTKFAQALAPAIILAVQTILDNAEVSVNVPNATSGSETLPGTGTLS